MITVEEAKQILIENSSKAERISKKNTGNCSGYFLAEDIFSKLDLPPFDQSNVDGYAINISGSGSRKVIAEIKAGDNPKIKLGEGKAVRIFTGAVVPDGADSVVMQENVTVNGNKIIIDEKLISEGAFIRIKGSQIKKEELAVSKNTYISPAVAGFIASLGIRKVKVYEKPNIHLIITGNELQSPGKKLAKGKVYESNSFILKSALEHMNLKISSVNFIKDNKSKLKKAVSESLNKADVIFISGGVSVGKYDFANEVLENLGVKKLFYKVSQRPGKPLYFGKKNSSYIFGLPGNPASVFTCFYEFVYPLLRKIQGFENIFLKEMMLPVTKELKKSFNLSNFLKAKASENSVESLEGQASYILRTFAEANCFIYLPLEKTNVKKGENVEVHLFPF